MASKCSAAYSSFASAASNSNGHLVILEGTDATSSMLPSYVRIGWYVGSGGSELTQFYSNGYPANYKIGVYATRFVDLYWDGTANTCYDYGSGSYILDIGQSADPYNSGVYLSTYPVTYPSGYIGDDIPDGTAIDHDGDNLNAAQELIQGTSDGSIDTDNDGIDDLKESIWFEDRDDVFCKTTVTPHVCSYPDPKKQDVYVEVDWMNDGVNSRSFKPTDTQIGLIEDAFSAKNINFHADTGQFGGGNELPTYTQTLYTGDTPYHIDFDDYKHGYSPYAANFNSNRESIWHYMISGYNFAEDPNSSGIAEVSGNDIFVSYGLVKEEFSYSDEDDALAGTMIHEIGHNLCLSSSQTYSEQPAECNYGGIDSEDLTYLFYQSAMNYRYQLDTVDYSSGSNLFDHDDWSAVKLGMKNFSGTKTYLGVSKKAVNTDDKVAFDVDHSAINEMSPEDSSQIYEQKQTEEKDSGSNSEQPRENSVTNESESPTKSSGDSGHDTKRVQKDTNKPGNIWRVLVPGVALLVLVTGTIFTIYYKKMYSKK